MRGPKRINAIWGNRLLQVVLVSVLMMCFCIGGALAETIYEELPPNEDTLNGNSVIGVNEDFDVNKVSLDTNGAFIAYTKDRNATYANYYFPVDGKLEVEGIPFQLAAGDPDTAFDGNDSLVLSTAKSSATVELEKTGVYDKIHVLVTGADIFGGSADFTVELGYTDNETTKKTFNVPDWFTRYPDLPDWHTVRWNYYGAGSYNKNDYGPRLYVATIEADPTKVLSSLTFSIPDHYYDDNNEVYVGVYAVTGAITKGTLAAPVALDETDYKKVYLYGKLGGGRRGG